MAQVHRMFFHYSEFPLSMRTLFTGTLCVLGLGYIFGMLHIYNSHAGRDTQAGLSVQDIAIAYSGSKESTRLEAALLGPMAGMLPADEKAIVMTWIHQRDANAEEYETDIRPLFEKRCLACHDGSNPHIANLDGYNRITEFAEVDTGADIFTLIRVSHIHLFGMTFVFFVMGLIFSHAYVRPLWLKSLIIILPFIAIVSDIGSWYLTKLYTPFAWIVIIGGAVMGVCFAAMWLISMYQIWFYRFHRNEPATEVVDP